MALDREERLRRHRIVSKRYYEKNKVKVNQWHKEYRKKNKDKISEYGYKLRARPEYQERVKKWREEHKEHLREYKKSPEYKQKKSLADKNYRKKIMSDPQKHKEHLEKQRIKRSKTRDRIRKYNQKYYTSPKGIINYTYQNHRRLAAIKSRPCDLSNEKIKMIWERDKVCVYCGSNEKLELDHIIALINGGASIFNNMVVACARCNRCKNDKDVFEWCKSMNREVPKIVLELLEKQKSDVFAFKVAA